MAHLPKYEQVKQKLIAELRSGVYAPGDRIPTREELIHKFGVTRTTVNQALKELVDCGVLSTSRRGGTIVTGRALPRRIAFLSWLVDPNIMGSGHDEATTAALLNPLLYHSSEFNLEFFDITEVDLSGEFICRYDCVVAVMPNDVQMAALAVHADRVLFVNRYGDGLNFVSTAHREEEKRLVAENIRRAGKGAQAIFLSGRLDACGFVGSERCAGFTEACSEADIPCRIAELKSVDFDGIGMELSSIDLHNAARLVVCAPSCAYTGAVINWAESCGLSFNENIFYSDFDNPNSLLNTGIAVPSAVQDYGAMGQEIYKALKNWDGNPVQVFVKCSKV